MMVSVRILAFLALAVVGLRADQTAPRTHCIQDDKLLKCALILPNASNSSEYRELQWYQRYHDKPDSRIGITPVVDFTTRLMFVLWIEHFDNQTDIYAILNSGEGSRATIPYPIRNTNKRKYVTETKPYSESELVNFTCKNGDSQVGWIDPTGNRITTYEKANHSQKFHKEDNGSIICCLRYVTQGTIMIRYIEYMYTLIYYYEKPSDQHTRETIKAINGPYHFSYSSYNEYMLFEIILKNIPPSVTKIYLIYSGKENFYEHNWTHEKLIVDKEVKNGEVTITFPKNTLDYRNIKIDVELETTEGLCTKSKVTEGRGDMNPHYYWNETLQKYVFWHTHWTYDSSNACRLPNMCEIVIDFQNQCKDTRNVITTEEPNSESDDDGTVSTSPRINIDTATIKSTASYENTSETSEDTKTSSSTVTILYSICGVGLTALVIVGIYWCWSTRRPEGTHGLPVINQPTEPFYLNMLFRRQCDQEIAEIEHHYEEIDQYQTPGESEGSGHSQEQQQDGCGYRVRKD